MSALEKLIESKKISLQINSALKAIDDLNWDRSLRQRKDLVPMARRAGAFASAAIEGAPIPKDPRLDPDDSPMGKLSKSALGINAEIDFQLKTFNKTPLQTWARLHSFIDSSDERGRPRTTNEIDDPLHIGNALDHKFIEQRLNGLVDLVLNTKAPVLLIAAIAHAEFATISPFRRGSQMLARATTRLVIQANDVDQLRLVMPEYGFYKIGRTKYAKGLIAYRSGTLEGIEEWIKIHSKAIQIAVSEVNILLGLVAPYE